MSFVPQPCDGIVPGCTACGVNRGDRDDEDGEQHDSQDEPVEERVESVPPTLRETLLRVQVVNQFDLSCPSLYICPNVVRCQAFHRKTCGFRFTTQSGLCIKTAHSRRLPIAIQKGIKWRGRLLMSVFRCSCSWRCLSSAWS